MMKEVWCVVDAVRVQGVVQTEFPVIAVAADLTYDLTITQDGLGAPYAITNVEPVNNRPAGNVLIQRVPWGFSAKIVGGELQAEIEEHRNAVPCP